MPNRISGLSSSGLNIDDVVAKLMTAERIPLTKLNQKQQILQWQRDEYRSMNSKFLELKSQAFTMKQPTTYTTNKTSSSDETSVSAAATGYATPGNYSVLVKQLAASAFSTSELTVGAADGAKALSTINGGSFAAATTLTIYGEKGASTIAVNPTYTIDTFVSAVNAKSSTTGVKVSYDSTADQFFFISSTTGAAAKIDLSTPDANFLHDILKLTPDGTNSGGIVTGAAFKSSIGDADTSKVINSGLTGDQKFLLSYTGAADVTITVTSTTTIGSLINSINSSATGQAGVSAYLDQATGELKFSNPNASKNLTFTDKTADINDLLSSLGLNNLPTPGVAANFSHKSVTGKNAIVNFNNNLLDTTYSSNTFTLANVTFTAKKAATAGLSAVSAAAINISVSQDTDTIYNSIKAFVDKYNDVISVVNDKISEQKNRDFLPLSDEEKKSMKDSDITAWEAKAKSGLIRNDSLLSSGMTIFRSGLGSTVSGLPSGNLKLLSDIGITTSANYLDKGKLVIDEIKLRQAITATPDQVASLFSADDGITNSETGDGIAVRIYNEANNAITNVTAKAGNQYSISSTYLIGKQLTDLSNRIVNMNNRLTNKESNYYKQFTAMDTALNKMNQQTQQLIAKMGG